MKEHDRGSGFRGLTGVEDDATVRVAHLPVPLHGGGCPGRSGEETQASGPPHHAPSGATKDSSRFPRVTVGSSTGTACLGTNEKSQSPYF